MTDTANNLDVAQETRRTLESLVSCTSLIERLSTYLGRLARHPEQDRHADVAAAFETLNKHIEALLSDTRQSHRYLAKHHPHEVDRPKRTSLSDMPGQCVLSGLSPDVPVATVLAFLGENAMTGTLFIRTAQENVTLSLADGDVIHAVSDRPPESARIGEILVQRGAIDQQTLDRLLDKYASSPVAMGEALEREALVTGEEMKEALRDQVQALFHRLFSADEAAFHFYTGDSAIPELRVRMKTLQLLLESARQHDERQLDLSVLDVEFPGDDA